MVKNQNQYPRNDLKSLSGEGEHALIGSASRDIGTRELLQVTMTVGDIVRLPRE